MCRQLICHQCECILTGDGDFTLCPQMKEAIRAERTMTCPSLHVMKQGPYPQLCDECTIDRTRMSRAQAPSLQQTTESYLCSSYQNPMGPMWVQPLNYFVEGRYPLCLDRKFGNAMVILLACPLSLFSELTYYFDRSLRVQLSFLVTFRVWRMPLVLLSHTG